MLFFMQRVRLLKDTHTFVQDHKTGMTYFYIPMRRKIYEHYNWCKNIYVCNVRLNPVYFPLQECRNINHSFRSCNSYKEYFGYPSKRYNIRLTYSDHLQKQYKCTQLYSYSGIVSRPWHLDVTEKRYFRNQITYTHHRSFSVQSDMGSSIQMQTGYFKFLSESFPVAFTQDFLLYMHEFSGLPWWATIVVTTLLFRVIVTLPLAIYQNYIFAKIENLTLEMPGIVKELKMETAYAIKKFNWNQKEARIAYNRSLKKQWNKLIIRDNCHPAKAGILLLAQIPMWICLSVALRNLVYMLPHQDTVAQITCMELSVGGLLWIPNLILPDSSWILPVAFGVTNLAIIELQTLSKVKKRSQFQMYATNFFRVVSVVMIPVAASVPACMSLYWVTSSIFGLAQNLTLLSPRVKRLNGIPDTPTMLLNPYSHIASQIKERATKFSNWSKVKT